MKRVDFYICYTVVGLLIGCGSFGAIGPKSSGEGIQHEEEVFVEEMVIPLEKKENKYKRIKLCPDEDGNIFPLIEYVQDEEVIFYGKEGIIQLRESLKLPLGVALMIMALGI